MGYEWQSLWIDKNKRTISLDSEFILGVTMDNLEAKCHYHDAAMCTVLEVEGPEQRYLRQTHIKDFAGHG